MRAKSTPKKVMFNFLVGKRESGKEDAFQTPKLKKNMNHFATDMFTFKHGEDGYV